MPFYLRVWVAFKSSFYISQIWKILHQKLGVLVKYTPLYHPQSLGHLERTHKDIKLSLKTALISMGAKHGKLWPLALPWVLLTWS